MLFFSPLKFFVFPFVFLVALPLALCAGVTTIVAFLVLFLRLFLVYFDVGLETLRYALIGHATHARYIASHGTPAVTPGSSVNSTPLPSPAVTTSRHRRRGKRHGSGGGGLITPGSGFDGFSAVTPSIGLERDFEGVGGWRLESTDVDTDNPEERQWCNLNSRLENPYGRHHFRTQSGGAILSGPTGSGILARPSFMTRSHSPEESKRSSSPSRSSSRTPTMNKHQGRTKADQEDYFHVYDGKNTRKPAV
ncbi:hypothetical protein F4824DRAFT_517614 [Ustulina deusta]|nr:hypothetical protein F4823DRAFT_567486 [Ustulina deusta]KAI3328340.1 hypothetical protein F4824DRAFT_517614 [Ustulina deusta]